MPRNRSAIVALQKLEADREALDAILARGAALARERAVPTLAATYDALGLVRG